MGLRTTWLVLYILFIFHLQHNLTSVSSRPSSVDTYHEALPFSVSKPDVVFEGKARELAVVIKRGGGGGRGGGGARSGGSSRRGGGGSSSSRSRDWQRGGGVIPIHTGGGSAGSHRSSGSRNLRGTVCAFGWLALSVLAGLVLVQ